jgi:glutamate synthase domain-containing protein 3
VDGAVNDYAGKGLSGGIFAVRPPSGVGFTAESNVIAGNVALYGATSGRAFVRGLAGERFAVRNSGARSVVEGVGDHGCEYMTGGRVAVLGPTGVNFAAGMSGGVAWVLDPEGTFEERCNRELVDLEPVGEEYAQELVDLLAEHHARTGSVVAEELLADWPNRVTGFVQVMPRDYRRALRERAERAEPEPAEAAAS